MARDRTYLESAIQGAAAVPVMAGVARGAQVLARGSKAAPYAGQFAQSVIPTTGRQLVGEGLLGAAAGAAGEFGARAAPHLAAQGISPLGVGLMNMAQTPGLFSGVGYSGYTNPMTGGSLSTWASPAGVGTGQQSQMLWDQVYGR
jgi:hypothetical protein